MPLSSHPDIFEISVRRFIDSNNLVADRARVGVALSGGADSVALMTVLSRLGFDTIALHCNFHLRGDESIRDQHHAEAVAARLGRPIKTAHFDVARRMAADGSSVEMACRDLRYEWFATMASELHLDAVAVGHHRADRAETFMLNALRGSGIRGLCSPQARRGIFVRPLLDCSRRDILDYLGRRGIDYVEDSTNASCDFLRNRLRNRVFPALEEGFPDVAARLSATIGNLDRQRRLFESLVAQKGATYFNAGSTELDIRGIVDNEPYPSDLIFELLRDRGVNRSMATDIVKSIGQSGRRFGPWTLNRGRLHFAAPRGDAGSANRFDFDSLIRVDIVDKSQFHPTRDPGVAWFDAAILDDEPHFELRSWKRGDRMRPFGMGGTRLVSDIFAEARLSLDHKATQPILWRGDSIVWIPGVKCSASFPVTPATTRIAKFTLR